MTDIYRSPPARSSVGFFRYKSPRFSIEFYSLRQREKIIMSLKKSETVYRMEEEQQLDQLDVTDGTTAVLRIRTDKGRFSAYLGKDRRRGIAFFLCLLFVAVGFAISLGFAVKPCPECAVRKKIFFFYYSWSIFQVALIIDYYCIFSVSCCSQLSML